MTLTYYGHPLSSYCWKALVALHEAGLSFDFEEINLGDPDAVARFRQISPFGKMPALRDTDFDLTTSEATMVIEHLAARYSSAASLIPADIAAAHQVRLWDRYFDLHLHHHMQQVINNRLRPEGSKDPLGLERAHAAIRMAYEVIEARMADREWVADGFSLADCAAAPALHYANRVEPIGAAYPRVAAYLARLEARPSFARVLEAARPYAHMFPAG